MSECQDGGCYCQDDRPDAEPYQSPLRQAMVEWEANEPTDLNSAKQEGE